MRTKEILKEIISVLIMLIALCLTELGWVMTSNYRFIPLVLGYGLFGAFWNKELIK